MELDEVYRQMEADKPTLRVLDDILEERHKWPRDDEQDSMTAVEWAGIAGNHMGTALRDTDSPEFRARLIRAAEVIVAWIEAIDRRGDARITDG